MDCLFVNILPSVEDIDTDSEMPALTDGDSSDVESDLCSTRATSSTCSSESSFRDANDDAYFSSILAGDFLFDCIRRLRFQE